MNWAGQDLITARGVKREQIEEVMSLAREMEPIASGRTKTDAMAGKILATLFFEPSTRTQLSFQTAMIRLGGSCIGFSGEGGTSVAKGETLHDTIKLVEACANAIAIRHPLEGSAQIAAEASSVPVINAGDGSNQHPTQTLVDCYTIYKEKKKIDGLTVLMAGDLKYGRTVHSLAYALSNYDVELLMYSPPSLKMPANIINEIRNTIRVRELASLDVEGADVVYATRVQKERFPSIEEYNKNQYKITLDTMARMKRDAILMHPLPKIDEIAIGVEADPRAAFYRQEANGVPVRMALLARILGGA